MSISKIIYRIAHLESRSILVIWMLAIVFFYYRYIYVFDLPSPSMYPYPIEIALMLLWWGYFWYGLVVQTVTDFMRVLAHICIFICIVIFTAAGFKLIE